MFYGLINIPDFRPSRAHPLHRAKRKAIEKANPHFDLKEAGLKGAVLVVLAAIACYPRIKAEHDMKHHPKRFENNSGKVMERGKGDRGHDRRRSDGYSREMVVHAGRNWDRGLEDGMRGSEGWNRPRRLEGGNGRRSVDGRRR